MLPKLDEVRDGNDTEARCVHPKNAPLRASAPLIFEREGKLAAVRLVQFMKMYDMPCAAMVVSELRLKDVKFEQPLKAEPNELVATVSSALKSIFSRLVHPSKVLPKELEVPDTVLSELRLTVLSLLQYWNAYLNAVVPETVVSAPKSAVSSFPQFANAVLKQLAPDTVTNEPKSTDSRSEQ